MKKEAKKNKKTFFRPANQRGSILAFSLIILFILMVIAIGVSTVSVKERGMSSDTGKSVVAYQAADTGMEIVLNAIIKDGQVSVDALDDGGMNCDDSSGEAVIGGSAPIGGYELTFEDANGAIDVCGDSDNIVEIKSAGEYEGVVRAVEVNID